MDGGEVNDSNGGVRSTVSQDAVQEFQINRSNYSAELGAATGGVINIVTRSGTNQLHGSLFGFFRHASLDAGDPFARVLRSDRMERIKPPSQRQQFGAALGMPLKKDRTFLFAAAEGLIRNESSVVSLLTDRSIFRPTPQQEAVLSQLPAETAGQLRSLLTSPPSTVALFERNSGAFPFATHDWKFSVRLDHHSARRGQFFLRYNFATSHEQNANLQALVGATRGTDMKLFDSTAIVGWTRSFSDRFLNEARVQWGYGRLFADSVEKFGPEIRIEGFGHFNRDFLLPSRSLDRRYQIKDNVTYVRGPHILKAGAEILVRGTDLLSSTTFGGRFSFGDLPGALLGIPNLPPSFTINALQAFNLGLPQAMIYGSGNPTVAGTYPYYGFYVQDSWKARPNLTLDFGVRYELDTRTAQVPTDTNNIAPRFGFAWDPFRDKKTTVRGGYGIYYAPLHFLVDWSSTAVGVIDGYRQIAIVVPTLLDPGPSNVANIFGTLRRQGVITVPTPTRSIQPADLAQFGIHFTHTGPIPPFSLLAASSSDLVNPYAHQASLAVERQIGQDWAVSIEYGFVRTLKLYRLRDRNLLPAPVDPSLGIRVWNSPQYFADPLIGQNNFFEPIVRSFYSGMIVEVRKRFRRSFSLGGNWTFSRSTDEAVDYVRDYQAADQTNLRAERALSSFDQRHKLVAYGLWTAPGGFQLSPIFRANSARPFNLIVGFDLNQDRNDTTDRPPGAGRNTGIGPNFWTIDLRLARTIPFRESLSAELTLEAFNLFNRLNFASINNIVGNIPPPFNLRGRHDRSPSEPLGFSSACDPRRIQWGVRIRF